MPRTPFALLARNKTHLYTDVAGTANRNASYPESDNAAADQGSSRARGKQRVDLYGNRDAILNFQDIPIPEGEAIQTSELITPSSVNQSATLPNSEPDVVSLHDAPFKEEVREFDEAADFPGTREPCPSTLRDHVEVIPRGCAVDAQVFHDPAQSIAPSHLTAETKHRQADGAGFLAECESRVGSARAARIQEYMAALQTHENDVSARHRERNSYSSRLQVELNVGKLLSATGSDAFVEQLRDQWMKPVWGALGLANGAVVQGRVLIDSTSYCRLVSLEERLRWETAPDELASLVSGWDQLAAEQCVVDAGGEKGSAVALCVASSGFGVELPAFVRSWVKRKKAGSNSFPEWSAVCLVVDVDASSMEQSLLICEVYDLADDTCKAFQFAET